MGNAAGKLNSSTVCDGGGLVPNGIYSTEAQDFDAKAVQRLILSRHMAPFYAGADEAEEDSKASAPSGSDDGWWSYNLMLAQRESSEPPGGSSSTDQMSSASSADEGGIHQAGDGRRGHARKGSGLLRRLKGPSPPLPGEAAPQSPSRAQSTPLAQHERSLSDSAPGSEPMWRQLLRRHIECPICFLFYPKNINYTRCCHKPICTECFVQIKRKLEDDCIAPTHCPYCVEPNLGIIYYAPAIGIAASSRSHRKQLSSQMSHSSIASAAKASASPPAASNADLPASAQLQQHIRSATNPGFPQKAGEAGRTRSHSSASALGGTASSRMEPTIVMSDDIRPALSRDLAAQLEAKRKMQLRSAENMAMVAAATRRMSSRQQRRMSGDTPDDVPLAATRQGTRLFARTGPSSSVRPSATRTRTAPIYESEYSDLYAEMRAAGHTDLEEFLIQRAIRMSLQEEDTPAQQQQQQQDPQAPLEADNHTADLANEQPTDGVLEQGTISIDELGNESLVDPPPQPPPRRDRSLTGSSTIQ
ncbi:SNF1-interacting protein [Coemansia sp. RSA 1933]|nr:SNF1-interacting protein [Coemansia sp. RSA 1933]